MAGHLSDRADKFAKRITKKDEEQDDRSPEVKLAQFSEEHTSARMKRGRKEVKVRRGR